MRGEVLHVELHALHAAYYGMIRLKQTFWYCHYWIINKSVTYLAIYK